MTNKAAVLAFAALSSTVFGAAARAEDVKIHGSFTSSIVQQVVNPTAADSMVIAEVAKGQAAEPGAPLDGAKVFMNETVVLEKGHGPQHGVITLSNAKGSLTNSYWGAVKTTMVDGKPQITTSGDWKVIGGSGMFAGADGKGTYAGGFISKTDIKADYKGTLTMKSAAGQ